VLNLESILLYSVLFQDGKTTLGDCKPDSVTVSINKCDSIAGVRLLFREI
jgi:hypothetical protein